MDDLNGIGARIGSAVDTSPDRGPFLDMGRDIPTSTQADVDRILSCAKRAVVDGYDLLQSLSKHQKTVQAAFLEGCEIGSQGWMDAEETGAAWRYSDTLKDLRRSPQGRDVIGWRALFDGDVWTIMAVRHRKIWLSNATRDVIADGSAVRLLTGEHVFPASDMGSNSQPENSDAE